AGALPPAGPAAGTQLELRAPGESRHFDARHWVAGRIDGEALALTRRIASGLAETRGWNARIVIETGRALAVVLADHAPGDMIAWSGLSPALHSRDLSVTRTAEILDLVLPGAEGADERCVVRADGAGRENPAGRCCGGVFIGEVPVVVGMVPVVSVDDLGDCGAGSGLVDEVLA
ncbi:MAG TPA: hypothetical protein VK594_01510, partial [Streptosporangiaceae bacterium]|nr:hypothetical protein [Streptosporangiaceae bacterium]